MITRLLPAAFTALGLVAVYWLYALAVVPLIEISRSRQEADDRPSNRENREPDGGIYADLLATYFPAGHWTRARPPKVLETRQAMLIFADFEETDDGRVRLEPTAMIFFPQPRVPGERLPRNAIIMEASQGALFRFDGGFRMDHGQIGKFDWGVLQGNVIIRSDMEDDGPQDDLVVRVSDVQINERRIWSNDDVAFQLGSNHGTGTKLEIRFLHAAAAEGPRQHGLDIGGVLSVEISKNVDVTMVVGESSALFGPVRSQRSQAPAPYPPTPLGESVRTSNAYAANDSEKMDGVNWQQGRGSVLTVGPRSAAAPEVPIHVTCKGSFIFHFERQFAQFDKDVRVTRANRVGPPDLLECQMLDVDFESSSEVSTIASSPSIDLRPIRLVAFGAPVQVDAPSTGTHIRCERLTYELDDARVVLETITPGHNVSMRWKGPEWTVKIESPAMSYQFDPSAPRARIGILHAAGPGWFRATERNGGDDSAFTAVWTDRVDLQRDKGQPVLSLYGSPKIAFGGLGGTSGNQMHLWLKEPLALPGKSPNNHSPQVKSKPRQPFVLPDRMVVLGNVEVDSPQLVARLGQLHVWFRHGEENGADRAESSSSAESMESHRFQELLHGKKEGRESVYEMEAGLLQLELAVSGMATGGGRTSAEVKHIWTTGGLVLQQRPANPGEAVPLDIRGDRLHVENADAPGAVVELFGKADTSGPESFASISAQGATIWGRQMLLDRAGNRMLIPSAGELSMPLDRQLDGRPLSRPQLVTISWNDRFDFDGSEAVFSSGVRARGAGGWMQANKLIATLDRKIDFGTGTSETIDIDRIRCEGDVVVDRRERDGSGIIGHEHFEVPFLSINRLTGDIDGRGPGWMRSVRYAGVAPHWPTTNRDLERPRVVRGQSPDSSPSIRISQVAISDRPPQAGASSLRYLRIDFQNRLDGNLHRREMLVEGSVHAIYGPVDSWEQKIRVGGPAWKNGAMALNCDRLSAIQMRGGPRRQDWSELEASGNVEIEGFNPQFGAFAARAQKLTYDQHKDLLILDGGTSDARLWREHSAENEPVYSFGTPTGTTVARKIRYSRSRNHIAIEDVRSIDMSQF